MCARLWSKADFRRTTSRRSSCSRQSMPGCRPPTTPSRKPARSSPRLRRQNSEFRRRLLAFSRVGAPPGTGAAMVEVRKGMPPVQLDEQEFKRRFLARFYDPAFEPLQTELERIADAAWD